MDRITFDNNDHDACSQQSFDSVSSLSSSTTWSTTASDDQNEKEMESMAKPITDNPDDAQRDEDLEAAKAMARIIPATTTWVRSRT